MSFSINTVYNFGKTFKISIIFTFFYVGVNGIVLLVNGFKYPVNPLFTFLTSWFNLSEDYSYSSFYVGFSLNFLLPLGVIAFYECCLMSSPLRGKYYFVNVYLFFVCSIIATYVMSAINWSEFHYPGNGSSILAFSLFIIATFYSWLNFTFYSFKDFWRIKTRKHLRTKTNSPIIPRTLVSILAIIAYAITYFLFISQNKSWGLHISGFIIFILFVSFFKSGLFIYRSLKNKRMGNPIN